jgi:hypothetical protein
VVCGDSCRPKLPGKLAQFLGDSVNLVGHLGDLGGRHRLQCRPTRFPIQSRFDRVDVGALLIEPSGVKDSIAPAV